MRCICLIVALAVLPLGGWSQSAVPALPSAPVQAPGPSTPSTAAGGTIAGVIRSGQTPLPGVTVTAKNTLTGKQYVTATDSRGNFKLHIDEDGRYVVRTEFAGFASTTKEVMLHGGAAAQPTDFALMLESRQQQMEQAEARREAAQRGGQGPRQYMGGQGAQSMGLLAGAIGAAAAGAEGGGAALPSGANNNDVSAESVMVNGQSGTTNPFAGVNMQQMRENLENMQQEQTLAQIPGQRQGNFEGFGGGGGPAIRVGPGGGGPGGGGGPPPGAVVFGGRGGGRGGFNFRHFNPSKPHGALFWSGGNSLFDAKGFALRGQDVPQPPYNSN
ncbi:MAG TPA: carboxypeptidase regulatory-like domain-containing protein, partial [Acidobacteriaceae bacterium]